ncbi:hypothetical protein MHY85_03125 [Cellulomonas sp. ACRRI]|uniref:hypothetical protein n=1 Tax=Cellulomonas sp. ACRRI TaxID=2918188 RepID=UPI001EF30C33|nr:hypothetical protein [Cellulomonas sp. ACRRI]MCG7284964.1 hypothetical protein [Cellulomonas sp. ACRRI]
MARRAKIRVKWRNGAFADLRTEPAVMDELDAYAEHIAAAAGDGFEARMAEETGGRVRGRAAVLTTTTEAMRDNAKNHTLLRALGQAKG